MQVRVVHETDKSASTSLAMSERDRDGGVLIEAENLHIAISHGWKMQALDSSSQKQESEPIELSSDLEEITEDPGSEVPAKRKPGRPPKA